MTAKGSIFPACWFMSYAFSSKSASIVGEPRFGCCVSRGEHPIAKVMRWNAEHEHRIITLISFQEIDGAEYERFRDFDFETN